MAIFARKIKSNDEDRNSKKEHGSIFRSRKDIDQLRQAQTETTETSFPEPEISSGPPVTRNTGKGRTPSIRSSSGKSRMPAIPGTSDLHMSGTDPEKTPTPIRDRTVIRRSVSSNMRRSDHNSRMDMQTVSDSPTLGHSRHVIVGRDRCYFRTNHSDSGYESAETTFIPHATHRSSAQESENNHCDLESHSGKSLTFSKPTLFQRKRAERSSQQGSVPASQAPQVPIDPSPAAHEVLIPAASSQGLPLPPVSTLDGFKVNTKGRILDEEGDVIGELFEGDLLDCVRQKANAFGEVLDDYGRVVGRVRTVHRSAGTPSMHATMPNRMPQRYASPTSGEPDPISPLLLPTSRESSNVHTHSQQLQRAYEQPPADHLNAESATPRERRNGSEASLGALPDFDVSGSSILPDTTSAAQADRQAQTIVQEPPCSQDEAKAKIEKAAPSPSVTFASPEYKLADRPVQDRPKAPRRAESERSAPAFTRSQSHMSINSILASKTPEEGRSAYTPSLFSYKGEIPAVDGPQGNARLRKQPSSVFSDSRQGPPALNVKIAHVTSGAGQRRVQITDDLMGMPLTRPTLGTRNSVSSSYKRSPLSSTDVTPSGSTDGTDHSVSDDGKSPMSYYSPATSLYAGQSAHTQSNAAVRTYFSHAGRVTVQPGEEAPALSTPAPAPKPVELAPPSEKEKKKSRFGLFGKK